MIKAPAVRCLRNGAKFRSHRAHCPSSTADLSAPRLFRLHLDLPPGFILRTAQTSARTRRKAKKGCFCCSCQPRVTHRAGQRGGAGLIYLLPRPWSTGSKRTNCGDSLGNKMRRKKPFLMKHKERNLSKKKKKFL